MEEIKEMLFNFKKDIDDKFGLVFEKFATQDKRFEALENKIDKQKDDIIEILNKKFETREKQFQQNYEKKLNEVNDKICSNAKLNMKCGNEMQGRGDPVDIKLNSVQSELDLNKIVLATIDVKIEEMKKEILKLSTRVKEGSSSQFIYAELGRKAPSFDNKRKGGHPAQFLKTLDVYLPRLNISEGLKVQSSIECLEGDSKIWAERHSGEWGNYEDFKSAFKEEFWSQKIQNKVRLKIYEPRIYKANQGTMTHHVWGWINHTQYLIPHLPDESFIRAVSKHFSPEVEKYLVSARIETIDEFLQMVKDFDDVILRGYNGENHRSSSVRVSDLDENIHNRDITFNQSVITRDRDWEIARYNRTNTT